MIRRIYTSYLSNAGSPSFMRGHLPQFWSGGRTLTAANRITRRCGRIKDEGSSVRRFSLPLFSSHSSNPFLGASNSHRSSGTFNKAYVSLNKRPCDVTNRQLAPFPVRSVRRQLRSCRRLCRFKSSRSVRLQKLWLQIRPASFYQAKDSAILSSYSSCPIV